MILLSVCIPTKDRFELLVKTIQSIIADDAPKCKYEIVVSDNSSGDLVEQYCQSLLMQGYQIKHVRNRTLGFYNSIVALESGTGQLLKLHNDYSCFLPGMFNKMLEVVEGNTHAKPTLFFPNGALNITGARYCSTLDEFVDCTHFQSSWSSAFSIWRDEFEMTPHGKDEVNIMFPHTSLLFSCRDFYVLNDIFFENSEVKGKGGYNLFQTFCVEYLGLIAGMVTEKKVSKATFLKVKWKLFFNFIAPWYYKTVYVNHGFTYVVDDADVVIKGTYGFFAPIVLKFVCFLKCLLRV